MRWSLWVQRGRGALLSLRAVVTSRRFRVVVGALVVLSFCAVSLEALIRARIDLPSSRLPSAIYTRATPWGEGEDGARRMPVAIGTLDGAALEERIPVGLRELPDHLLEAVLAVEDQRFFRHHGLDFRRIGGALLANIRAVGIVEGGSTLTQQLAKNLFLTARRTPLRKIREAALATVLEMRYDKWTLLEAYLNEIYLGQDGGRAIHGVGAGARFYFGKDVRKITLAESAMLAGMIKSPNRLAPSRHPAAARERRDLVLKLMVEQERTTRTAAARARGTRIPGRVFPTRTLDSRHFRDFALPTVPEGQPSRGIAVYSTLDATLQRAAERAVRTGLDRLRNRGVEAALVALDPRTGEILAMVGGRDYGASQFNRATDALRQPGSAFKPIVALAALEPEGDQAPAFTLASMVEDEPLRVETASGTWEPSNYDRTYRGSVTLREAMEQSLNVPFARIGLAVGPERIAATARRLGITSELDPVPSLALGSSEVTLMELVRAYGVLAAGGDLAAPRWILGHGRLGGDIEEDGRTNVTRVVDPAVAYLVTSTLEGVIERGTGRALGSQGHAGGIAGKTGTSNNWRDAWFIAYSPSLVVGVWVGFDDGRSLRMPGSAAALPIVARFLAEASEDVDWTSFERPEGIAESYVGLGSNGDWVHDCGETEVFLTGTEPGGYGCTPFTLPDWDENRDWGAELKQRAERFLQDLIGDGLERRRSRR